MVLSHAGLTEELHQNNNNLCRHDFSCDLFLFHILSVLIQMYSSLAPSRLSVDKNSRIHYIGRLVGMQYSGEVKFIAHLSSKKALTVFALYSYSFLTFSTDISLNPPSFFNCLNAIKAKLSNPDNSSGVVHLLIRLVSFDIPWKTLSKERINHLLKYA